MRWSLCFRNSSAYSRRCIPGCFNGVRDTFEGRLKDLEEAVQLPGGAGGASKRSLQYALELLGPRVPRRGDELRRKLRIKT